MNSTERERRGSEPPGRTDRRQHAFCPPHQVRARTTRRQQHKEQQPIRICLYVYSTPLPAHPGHTNPCRGIGGPERAIAIAKHACVQNAIKSQWQIQNNSNTKLHFTTNLDRNCYGISASSNHQHLKHITNRKLKTSNQTRHQNARP